MVQVKVALSPAVIPVTSDVGDVSSVIVAVPLVTVHNPVPTVGVFPAKVNVAVSHCVISVPASDVVGKA